MTWIITEDSCNLILSKDGVKIETIPKEIIVLEIVLSGEPRNYSGINEVWVKHDGRYSSEIPYSDCTINGSAPISAESLRSQIVSFLNNNSCIGNGGGGGNTSTVRIRITSSDFMGNNYQNDLLIGLTAETDFDVWSAGGTGGLLNNGEGYAFVSGTGTMTLPADKYMIQI